MSGEDRKQSRGTGVAEEQSVLHTVSNHPCLPGLFCAWVSCSMNNSQICIISGLLFTPVQEAMCSRGSGLAFGAEA